MRIRLVLPLLLALLAATADAQTRYEWGGGAAGDWTDPANWSPNGVPAAADTAVLGEANQGARIATLTANTTVAGLELVRLGGVDGDVDLTVTDRFIWGGGGGGFDPIRGSGVLTIGPDATLRVTEEAARFRVGPERTVVNAGLLLWEAPVRWDGEGRIVNEGEIDLAFDGPANFNFVFSSLADALTNTATGVIRRTGTGDAQYVAGLVNDGLVRIENGSVDLRGFNATGTTGDGTIEVEPGGVLLVGGSTHTQPTVTGDAVTFELGRLVVTGTYDVTTTRFTGATGRLQLDGTGTTETLEMDAGFLDGTGTLTVTGALDWNGGRMEGTGTTVLGPSVPLTIGAATVSFGGSRTLRAEGPTTWAGEADISSGTNDATFENAGTLTSSGPGERTTFALQFRNTGTLVHEDGTLAFSGRMDNEGEVRVEAGVLRQQGFNSIGGTDTGRYEIAEGARLDFVGGNRTLTADAEVVGTGTVVFGPGGAVTNRATWRPGASPGILAVDSDWPSPAPESVLEVEIGGPNPGTDFDRLAVTGTAELGGTLRIVLTDGFLPDDGDRFLLIPAAAVAGSFDALDLPEGVEAFVEATDEGVELVIGLPVANEDDGSGADLPSAFALHAPAPNPVLSRTTLRYDLPEIARVRLVLFDVLGRRVAVVEDEERAMGQHEVTLDAADLPSGVYLVRMDAGAFRAARKFVRVR